MPSISIKQPPRALPLIFAAMVCSSLMLPMSETKAQVVDGKRIVTVEGLAPHSASGPLLVALRFTIEPGWYLYWKNPGDAGLSIDIRWELPDGFVAREPLYPTPTKIVDKQVVAYGYKKELILLCEIVPPTGYERTSPVQATAKLDWLVCKDHCVRGTATVSITLETAMPPTPTLTPGLTEIVLARLPKPSSVLNLRTSSATMNPTDEGYLLEMVLDGPDAPRVTDFYPEVFDDFVLEHLDISVGKGRIQIPLRPTEASMRLDHVRGLLLVDGEGYEYETPVTMSGGSSR